MLRGGDWCRGMRGRIHLGAWGTVAWRRVRGFYTRRGRKGRV